MPHYLQPNPMFKSSEYWDGYDILDIKNFTDLMPPPFKRTSRHQYYTSRNQLIEAQTAILHGTIADVTQRKSGRFDPSPQELEDGTVVIIDNEDISRWVYADPEKKIYWSEKRNYVIPPISRPFSEFWATNRRIPKTSDEPVNDAGIEVLGMYDENMIYTRMLNWGVIVSYEKKRRGIQPFSFNGDRQGNIDKYNRVFPWNIPVIPFPIEIGDVKPRTLSLHDYRTDEVTCNLDTLERIRGIDVVFPVTDSKERSRSKVKQLGRIAILKPAQQWNF